MSLVVADRVQETTTTTGTGTLTLLGPTTQYQSFSAGVGANNRTYYVLVDGNGTAWEVGLGTVGGGGSTLARTTILASSNSNAAINLSSNTHVVASDCPALLVSLLAGGTLSGGLQNYLVGLTMSNDGGTPNTILDISTGQASSDDNTLMMVLASAYTKTTGAWAVGSGNGGLDTGAVANGTWYHVYIIERPDTGVVDILFSTSATAPTMPTNYTKKRRIGSFATDGSAHIILFTQNGDNFRWAAPLVDISGGTTSGSTAAQTLSTSTPVGVVTEAIIVILAQNLSAATQIIYVSSLAQADVTPTANIYSVIGTPAVNASGLVIVATNLSAQARFRTANTTDLVGFTTLGWIDHRGRT